MSNRARVYASEGKQLGPYSEVELREFIARGAVRADTLVCTEGMANWQKAAKIPGLLSNSLGPPAVPYPGGLPTSTGDHGGGSLSIDLPLWASLRRSLL